MCCLGWPFRGASPLLQGSHIGEIYGDPVGAGLSREEAGPGTGYSREMEQ